MITDGQVAAMLERMAPETRAIFEVLSQWLQEAYLDFWSSRPDLHASHRDTLPAFVAGVFAAMPR